MTNLQRPPVETLHHICTLAEQMAQQAQRCDRPFLAYLLSMASKEASAELKSAGFPITTDKPAHMSSAVQ